MWFVSYVEVYYDMRSMQCCKVVDVHPLEWLMRENKTPNNRTVILWYTDLTHNEKELVNSLEEELKTKLDY